MAGALLRSHFTASSTLIALMLKNLPDKVRSRVIDAVNNGTGKVELRTRVHDESEPLWLARTGT